jgi:hypothetical protein
MHVSTNTWGVLLLLGMMIIGAISLSNLFATLQEGEEQPEAAGA